MPLERQYILKAKGDFKKAWALQRAAEKKKSKSKPKSASRASESGTSLSRRKSGMKFNLRKFKGIIQMGALAAPAAMTIADPNQSSHEKLVNVVYDYTGFDMGTKKWDWHGLINGWAPYVATTAVTEAAVRIPKIIRNLVNMF